MAAVAATAVVDGCVMHMLCCEHMIRTTLLLPAPLHQQLVAVSRQQGRSLSELARDLLHRGLTVERAPFMWSRPAQSILVFTPFPKVDNYATHLGHYIILYIIIQI